MTDQTTPQISAWTHPRTGQTRRYVNNWLELAGWEIDRYKSGNICWASLNGQKISNTKAGRVAGGKVWIDEAGALHVDYVAPEYVDGITEAVTAAIASVTA